MLQRPVLHRVEDGDARHREKDHRAEPGANRLPVALEVLPGHRKNDQERQSPAQER
jgi:hypothetical protein